MSDVVGVVVGRWDGHGVLLHTEEGETAYTLADPPWPDERIPDPGSRIACEVDEEGHIAGWRPA